MKTHVRWIFPILLAGVLILSACQPALQAAEVSPTEAEQPQTTGIPEIDLNQPDEFATATFSMG